MAKTIIAHPAPTVPVPESDELEHVSGIAARVLDRVQESRTRLEKTWQIYSEHASEIIASYSNGVWLIPSQSDGTSVYEVRLGRHGADCECPDFQYREGERCKHIIAAQYAAANSEHCAFCGQRFPYGELSAIGGDHYLGLACKGCGS